MRAFIAIELPEEARDFLRRLQGQLKTCGADAKWVAPSNIHLTLKFLGEIDERKLPEITAAMEAAVAEKHPFSVRLASLGAFPKIDYPRVIWVGIDKGDSEIKEVAKNLEESIARLGLPKEERPFSSHITVGRLRSQLNKDELAQALKTIKIEPQGPEFLAAKITLFKSVLAPSGPIYTALKEASFKTS